MPRKVFANSDEEEESGSWIFDYGDEKKKRKDEESSSDDDAIDAGLKDDDDGVDDKSDDDDDDDGAPDDLSFHAGMASAKAHIRSIVNHIKADALKTKAKRRKTNELYLQQKKKRLTTLMNRRLPDDVIHDLATPADRPKKTPKMVTGKRVEAEDADDEVTINPRLLSGDYLPLNISESRTGITAVTVEAVRRVPTASQQALQFKRTALYGGRIPRQSVNASLALQTKRKAARTPKMAKRIS